MNENKKNRTKSGLKHALIEWGIIGSVAAIIYVMGWHTEVLGTMQRAILWTGIFDAEVEEIKTTNGPSLTETAYSFTLYNPSGKQLSFESFKGKVLFINVWASWCPPCVAEMPTIETLYKKVEENEDIEFLLISLDEDPQKAIDFMEGREFAMPYYFPAKGLPAVFQSPYIPSTYVVSKEGKIIYQREGIADYSSDSFSNWLIERANSVE